jgi:hypothetical protein
MECMLEVKDGLDERVLDIPASGRRIPEACQADPDADLIVFQFPQQAVRACPFHGTACLPEGLCWTKPLCDSLYKAPQGMGRDGEVFDKGGKEKREGLSTSLSLMPVAAENPVPSLDDAHVRFCISIKKTVKDQEAAVLTMRTWCQFQHCMKITEFLFCPVKPLRFNRNLQKALNDSQFKDVLKALYHRTRSF